MIRRRRSAAVAARPSMPGDVVRLFFIPAVLSAILTNVKPSTRAGTSDTRQHVCRGPRYFGGVRGAFAAAGKDYVRQYGCGVTSFMTEAAQRRSARVLLDVPVAIWSESPDAETFREETFTVTVSAHGALIMLAAKVSVGQRAVIQKLTDSIEIRGRLAYVGMPHAG